MNGEQKALVPLEERHVRARFEGERRGKTGNSALVSESLAERVAIVEGARSRKSLLARALRRG